MDLKMPFVTLQGLPDDAVTALYMNGNDLWVGTSASGLYITNTSGKVVRKVSYTANSLGRAVNHITGLGGNIYVATRDGIYIFDDGASETAHLTTGEGGLPYNSIQYLFADSRGRLLFAPQPNGIYQLTEGHSVEPAYRAGDREMEFITIAEDGNGNIWAGTRGDGVIYFFNDTAMAFNEGSGLMSSFCYSLLHTSYNNIWIGHSNGLSRINTNTFRISSYDVNTGIEGSVNQNATLVLEDGKALIGTSEGIFTYDPSMERADQKPPFTNITRLMISDKPYDITDEIVLPFGRYKIRVDFIGLNYGDPQTVTYQYRLDGFETEWSDVTNLGYANYPRIEDGNYTFYVRSYNNEGLSEEAPAAFKIIVRKTLWENNMVSLYWAGRSCFLGSVLPYIKKSGERKQEKHFREYLEREP
jgi:ligand-binding sensor domain-containing protein